MSSEIPAKRIIFNPYKRKLISKINDDSKKCQENENHIRNHSDAKDANIVDDKDKYEYDDGFIDWSSIDVASLTTRELSNVHSRSMCSTHVLMKQNQNMKLNGSSLKQKADCSSEKTDPYDIDGIDWALVDIPAVGSQNVSSIIETESVVKNSAEATLSANVPTTEEDPHQNGDALTNLGGICNDTYTHDTCCFNNRSISLSSHYSSSFYNKSSPANHRENQNVQQPTPTSDYSHQSPHINLNHNQEDSVNEKRHQSNKHFISVCSSLGSPNSNSLQIQTRSDKDIRDNQRSIPNNSSPSSNSGTMSSYPTNQWRNKSIQPTSARKYSAQSIANSASNTSTRKNSESYQSNFSNQTQNKTANVLIGPILDNLDPATATSTLSSDTKRPSSFQSKGETKSYKSQIGVDSTTEKEITAYDDIYDVDGIDWASIELPGVSNIKGNCLIQIIDKENSHEQQNKFKPDSMSGKSLSSSQAIIPMKKPEQKQKSVSNIGVVEQPPELVYNLERVAAIEDKKYSHEQQSNGKPDSVSDTSLSSSQVIISIKKPIQKQKSISNIGVVELPPELAYDSDRVAAIEDKKYSHEQLNNGKPESVSEKSLLSSQTIISIMKPEQKQKSVSNFGVVELPPELAYDPERVAAIEDGNRLSLIKAADISSTLNNGWKLLLHQKKAVIRAIRMRRLVCAYDMGLGKTIIACVYAKAFKKTFSNIKIYVIAPVSLHSEWKKTAKEATGLCLEKETDDPFDMIVCSWGKIPAQPSTSIEKFIVICDEAHSIQSMESKRTRETLKLVLDHRCVGCLMLTGTPMKNGKPSNLFPLLKAVRHPFGDNQKAYEMNFCAGQQKNYGRGTVWDASGSSNLPILNYHMSSHVSYMTKEECLKDLPPKTRELRDTPVSSRDTMKHIAALNELAKAYEYTRKGDNGSSTDVILGAFSKVRMVAAFAKVDATVDLASSFLNKEPAIVIFSNFVEVCKLIHKKLEGCGWSGELLTGQTPAAKRQGLVDRFQGGISPVFVCTFGAGGVGLTLTAASIIILNDRPWTPGDALQAEDRVRRIGQTKPVISIWMRSFEIDKQIDDLINQKQSNYQSVVDKNHESDGQNKGAPKLSIINLIRSIIPPPNHNPVRGLTKTVD